MQFREFLEEISQEGRDEYVARYRISGRVFEVWLRVKGNTARITYFHSYGQGKSTFKEALPLLKADLEKLNITDVDWSVAIDDRTQGGARERLFNRYKQLALGEWLITEWGKYLTYGAAACEHCRNDLVGVYVSENLRHIYHIGQYWFCNCKKSRIWTNSVRSEKRFLEYLLKKEDRYTNGFCNDMFCGYCYAPIYPLKNGVPPIHGRVQADLFGCKKCKDNQNIQIWWGDLLKEGKEEELVEWYKKPSHLQELLFLMGYKRDQVAELLDAISEPDKLQKFKTDAYSGYLDRDRLTWIPKSKPR